MVGVPVSGSLVLCITLINQRSSGSLVTVQFIKNFTGGRSLPSKVLPPVTSAGRRPASWVHRWRGFVATKSLAWCGRRLFYLEAARCQPARLAHLERGQLLHGLHHALVEQRRRGGHYSDVVYRAAGLHGEGDAYRAADVGAQGRRRVAHGALKVLNEEGRAAGILRVLVAAGAAACSPEVGVGDGGRPCCAHRALGHAPTATSKA